MSLVEFETLPDDARLWCFAADRPPTPAETGRLLDDMSRFLDEWAAHGAPLRVGLEWRDHRFLLVAVDESAAGASGCSIDALTHHLGELEEELGLELRDAAPVWYRDPATAGSVGRVSRAEFRELAERGAVDGDTIVFDLTVERLADVRAGRWEVAARDAWHARLLPAARTTHRASAGGIVS